MARCGFPWEKTTKRPIASRISCSAALAESNYVRLSSQKVACSSVFPPTSTGNPGSVSTNCETALGDYICPIAEEEAAASLVKATVWSRIKFVLELAIGLGAR
jgi:hypothetical protein